MRLTRWPRPFTQAPGAMRTKTAPRYALIWIAVLALWCAGTVQAQPHGTLLDVEVPGPALEGNLLGMPTARAAQVYLPPGYDAGTRRYPVLYVLHGIGDPITVWTEPWSDDAAGYGTLQRLMDRGIDAGLVQPMIFVVVDARTPFPGGHYADSPVTGNWEDFIAEDLVGYMDTTYRTLPAAASRGILGHSMGGHGALRLGLKRPDVFSVVYGLNPSLLGWAGDVSAENPAFATLLTAEDPSAHFETDFYVAAIIGVSQAFSPNPQKPPFFADYPFRLEDGRVVPDPDAHARWEANFPASMIDGYLARGIPLRGLRFDSAFEDEFSHIPPTARALSARLTERGVEHTFEMYNGDHRNRLWGRGGRLYTEALPYFSRLLAGE